MAKLFFEREGPFGDIEYDGIIKLLGYIDDMLGYKIEHLSTNRHIFPGFRFTIEVDHRYSTRMLYGLCNYFKDKYGFIVKELEDE